MLPSLEPLRRALGVDVSEGALRHALTHSSHAYENGGEDNERLEFLGDAVLGQGVTAMLYRSFPQLPEGELAKRRAALVSTPTLAELAAGLGIGELLLLGRGEERTAGRTKPSLLADALEAIIGAVYLECGAVVAEGLVSTLMEPLVQRADPHHIADPKTALQELLAGKSLPPARYEVIGEGPDHDRVFRAEVFVDHAGYAGAPLGVGQGTSKKAAEISAAHSALQSFAGP